MKRETTECVPRARPEEVLAETGVSYLRTFLDISVMNQDVEEEENIDQELECMEQKLCLTARHVAGLSDPDGVVDNLNKILIKALALHLMETEHIQPQFIIEAGNWGRAWQNCNQKYKCGV